MTSEPRLSSSTQSPRNVSNLGQVLKKDSDGVTGISFTDSTGVECIERKAYSGGLPEARKLMEPAHCF